MPLLPLSRKGCSRSSSVKQLHQCRSWRILLPLSFPLRCDLLRGVTLGLQWSWVQCQPALIPYSTCTVTVQSLVIWEEFPCHSFSPGSLHCWPCPVSLGLAVNSEEDFWSFPFLGFLPSLSIFLSNLVLCDLQELRNRVVSLPLASWLKNKLISEMNHILF